MPWPAGVGLLLNSLDGSPVPHNGLMVSSQGFTRPPGPRCFPHAASICHPSPCPALPAPRPSSLMRRMPDRKSFARSATPTCGCPPKFRPILCPKGSVAPLLLPNPPPPKDGKKIPRVDRPRRRQPRLRPQLIQSQNPRFPRDAPNRPRKNSNALPQQQQQQERPIPSNPKPPRYP